MRVLVVNAGSSSLKLRLLDGSDEVLAERELSARGSQIDAGALESALDSSLGEAEAVGHRVVHGGSRFRSAVMIDEGVELALRELSDLAPLHQQKSLAALDAVSALLPGLPAVACFDTAFHASLPAAAATYALPQGWRDRWGLRRYGFHGLSHAWIARRAPQLLGPTEDELRIVSCHLGAGASLCAIRGGSSVDTTMGFTPLEGLVMATRSGSLDPGLLLWLLQHEHVSAAELSEALERNSGLLGLCGTADMPELLGRVEAGDRPAQLALDVYVHRLRAGVAAMAAALGGLDMLVFTAGVGERSATVRELTAAGLGFLGVAIDESRDASPGAERDVSAAHASVRTFVIAAREDLEIARQVRSVLAR